MAGTVEVMIPVDEDVAAKLADEREREAMGRMISNALRPRPMSDLELAMREIQRCAREAGLTDEEVDAELAAHKAERRARREAG